jgi:photosystem II stability/assembly factor-like uncharacterized protein
MAGRGLISHRQTNTRCWIQAGSNPAVIPEYFGQGQGQVRATSFNPSVEGSTTIFRPSDRKYGSIDAYGITRETPEPGTVSIVQDLNISQIGVLEYLKEKDEEVAIHIAWGKSGDSISDSNTWESKIVIPNAAMSSFGYSTDLQSDDADEVQVVTSEWAFDRDSKAVKISWAEKIAATIANPIRAVAFGDGDDNRIYVFEASDSSSVVPDFHWTTDFGSNWSTQAMTGLLAASGEDPNDLAAVGTVLLAPTEADTYVYAYESDLTSWTNVASSFTATKTPNAIWAPSLARTVFVGDGGYIYHLEGAGRIPDVADAGVTTTQDLMDVDGLGGTIVAVGNSNVVVHSPNYGSTYSLITGPDVGNNLLVVQVLDDDVWIVGSDAGNLFYTIDGGDNWNSIGFAGSGTGSITALEFWKENPAFGVMAHKTATPTASVFRTTDFGATWEQVTLDSYPTSQECNAIAVAGANTIVGGGIATGGTDGTLAIASANRYT